MTEWLKTTAKGGFRRVAGVFQSRTNERTFMQPFVIQRFEIESTLALFFIKKCNASYKYPIVVIISSSLEVIILDRLVRTSGHPVRCTSVYCRIISSSGISLYNTV